MQKSTDRILMVSMVCVGSAEMHGDGDERVCARPVDRQLRRLHRHRRRLPHPRGLLQRVSNFFAFAVIVVVAKLQYAAS